MKIWIHGGRVIDPGRLDGMFDILVDSGKIVDITPERPDTGTGRQNARCGCRQDRR